ncbi:unnamed protein product [Clavelina lepadiformis]|uniref:FH2 domain-containing protein n=1 Tax=Clavelina lepadiformis TaxID=159417 RepID=A0ABP0GTQ8_CLALP
MHNEYLDCNYWSIPLPDISKELSNYSHETSCNSQQGSVGVSIRIDPSSCNTAPQHIPAENGLFIAKAFTALTAIQPERDQYRLPFSSLLAQDCGTDTGLNRIKTSETLTNGKLNVLEDINWDKKHSRMGNGDSKSSKHHQNFHNNGHGKEVQSKELTNLPSSCSASTTTKASSKSKFAKESHRIKKKSEKKLQDEQKPKSTTHKSQSATEGIESNEVEKSTPSLLNCLEDVACLQEFTGKSLLTWLTCGVDSQNPDVNTFIKEFCGSLLKLGVLIEHDDSGTNDIEANSSYSWQDPSKWYSNLPITGSTQADARPPVLPMSSFDGDEDSTIITFRPRTRKGTRAANNRKAQVDQTEKKPSEMESFDYCDLIPENEPPSPILETNLQEQPDFPSENTYSNAMKALLAKDVAIQTTPPSARTTSMQTITYETREMSVQTIPAAKTLTAFQPSSDLSSHLGNGASLHGVLPPFVKHKNSENSQTPPPPPPPPPLVCVPPSPPPCPPVPGCPPPPPPPPCPPAPRCPPPPPPCPPVPGCPPPPPCPPAPGCPPPPPGNLILSKRASGLESSNQSGLSKTIIEPVKPMKPLYWTKIKLSASAAMPKRLIWENVEESDVNITELVDLFCKLNVTKKKPLSSTLGKATKKKKVAKILDTKRSQAVAIFTSSLHVEIDDIKQAMLNVDTSVVDIETMEAIYELRPQSGEMESIEAHVKRQEKLNDEKKEPLDKPEEFLWRLWQIPHFSDRLFCITFTTHLEEDIGEINKILKGINGTCETLQSNSMKKLFGVILALGNYMNGGNRTRGQADGFALEILSKLKDVKANMDNLNLLSYVAKVYIRSFNWKDGADILTTCPCPLPSTISVMRSSQVNFEDLHKDLRKITIKLKDCQRRVKVILKNAEAEDVQSFRQFMEEFLDKAFSQTEDTQKAIEKSQKCFESTANYFNVTGKTSKPVSPKDFFSLWLPFTADLNQLWPMQIRKILQEMSLEARKVVEERQKPQKIKVRTQQSLVKQKTSF